MNELIRKDSKSILEHLVKFFIEYILAKVFDELPLPVVCFIAMICCFCLVVLDLIEKNSIIFLF